MPKDVSSSSEGESENPPTESQPKQLGTSIRNTPGALVGRLVSYFLDHINQFIHKETRTQWLQRRLYRSSAFKCLALKNGQIITVFTVT